VNTTDSKQKLKAAHTPEAIRQRLESGPTHTYLRDAVYGAIDGAVTTFAIVSGVAGAELSMGIVLILGAANLLGDGFSMAAGNYLGTQAEVQLRQKARRTEERHIDIYPEGEREEIRQIVQAKGFEGDDLERAVEIITSDREQWINMMMREELGINDEGVSPITAASVTFIAFFIVGLVPLLPFILKAAAPSLAPAPFLLSTVMTGVAFFFVGIAKAKFVEESWLRAGVETLLVGGGAAGLAYVIGLLLKDLVGVAA
jgi:VIT1/CCC1 family predicted Fe2+/Mn2+ transporter